MKKPCIRKWKLSTITYKWVFGILFCLFVNYQLSAQKKDMFLIYSAIKQTIHEDTLKITEIDLRDLIELGSAGIFIKHDTVKKDSISITIARNKEDIFLVAGGSKISDEVNERDEHDTEFYKMRGMSIINDDKVSQMLVSVQHITSAPKDIGDFYLINVYQDDFVFKFVAVKLEQRKK